MSQGEQMQRHEMVRAVVAGLEMVRDADENPLGEHPPRVGRGGGMKAILQSGGTGRGRRRISEFVEVELHDGTVYEVHVSKRRRAGG